MNVQRIQTSGGLGWRAVLVAAGLVLTGFTTQAFALGLGEPNVASVLGQPLQMTVPLVMDRGTELAQECVRIVPGNRLGEPTPSLNAGRVTIDAGGRQLRIESLQPITEPTLRVVVEVGCTGHIRREFALLLDPPSMAAPFGSDVVGSTQSVSSLGLGMAQISAVLGQRLSIRVPVVGGDAASLTAGCVRLADPISSEGAPVLRQAEIRVLPNEGGALIEVATPGPVSEPAVRLALDVGCRDPLRREYAILLGLPALAASNVGTAVAAAEVATAEPEPKPAPRRAAKPRNAMPAAPVAPEQSQTHPAPVRPVEVARQAPQAATSSGDRLVLGSPEESVGSAATGADTAAALDPNAELIQRVDALSKQVEALQAQLVAARQREQELERQALETREEWTWSMIALAGLLLLGALVMAWRQRRPVPQAAWEPVVTRVPQAVAPKPVAARASTDAFVRESPEIAGRATMPGRATIPSAPSAAVTEPSLSDAKNTQITVTELHDTVQVIKELYATVLERNTAGAAGGSGGGKPSRPLELDLRAPTRAAAPSGSPAPLVEPVPSDGSDKRGTDERFTELPTEVGLDLDLSSVVAATPEVVLTDLLAPGNVKRSASSTQETAVAAAAETKVPLKGADSAARAADVASPVTGSARAQTAGHSGLSDENLTQTPTEVLIDIDVGTTTGFSHTTDRAAPRLNPQRPEAERTRNAPPTLEPIDLQLDLSQPQARSKQRAGRGA